MEIEFYELDMKWRLCIRSPGGFKGISLVVFLTPKQAAKLFEMMKEAGF